MSLSTHAGAELISLHRTGETRYYQYDDNGSVRLLTDGTGAVTDTYTYDAFGNLLAKTGTTVNNYLYNGEQFDANTGFYYLRARYMNPSTGTFISMDPAQGSIFDPVSLHKYLYANANPVINCDPSGRFTMLEMGLTMAISGVISGSMNLLYYDLHGGDQSATSTRLGIFFGGFFQGALMSGGLVGLALIGTVLTSALLALILTGLGIKGISDAADRFQARDYVWGWIFLASALACFLGARTSMVQASRIYDINVSNTSLANANAQRGSALPEAKSGNSNTKYLRQKAVKQAWQQEQAMVETTGKGTVEWNGPQKLELLETQRVKGYVGHHINNVANNPAMAGNPNNIQFVTVSDHFMISHNGNWRIPTSGELLSR